MAIIAKLLSFRPHEIATLTLAMTNKNHAIVAIITVPTDTLACNITVR